MNDIQQNKLERFAMDTVVSDSVYSLIRKSFLSRKGQRDVQILAAERIALELLDEAWKELSKYRIENNQESTGNKQIGL